MTNRADIYLSRSDVEALAHYAHYIPIGHGFSQRYVDQKYPGWLWNDLLPALLSTERYDRQTRTLRGNLVGVLFTAEGNIVDDDGSLAHPAKPLILSAVANTD